MLKLRKNIVVLRCAWLLGLGLLAAQHAGAATIASTKQGMSQWRARDGKLILIAGSYQDILIYKRSLTFF